MAVVWDLSLVFVFQVERINIEGVHYLSVYQRLSVLLIIVSSISYLESLTHMVANREHEQNMPDLFWGEEECYRTVLNTLECSRILSAKDARCVRFLD